MVRQAIGIIREVTVHDWLQAMTRLTGKTSDFLKIGVAAAGRGDLATVRSVLAQRPDWLQKVGSHGRTMLWEAAYRGRGQVAAFLLNEGADVDAWGCHFTPLLVEISPYCAARHRGHDSVADLLAAHGATEDFLTAVYLGNGQAVTRFLDEEPALANAERPQHDPNVRATALHYAVAAGHDDIVALLLERGARPDPFGGWLLRFCIWRDRPDILERLLGAGLHAESADLPRSGVANPTMLALLESHGIFEGPDHAEGGWPPIVFQSRGDRGGKVARVQALIDNGADVNARNHKGQTALHCAAKAGFAPIVSLLLEHQADVNACDAEGQAPLTAALRSTVKDKARLLEVVRLLVAAGADRHLPDNQGRTPLQIAAKKRDAKMWLAALDAT